MSVITLLYCYGGQNSVVTRIQVSSPDTFVFSTLLVDYIETHNICKSVRAFPNQAAL